MRHEDYGFGAMVDGILNGWESTVNSLRVRYILVRVKRHIEVDLSLVLEYSTSMVRNSYSDEDSLVLEVDVGDC